MTHQEYIELYLSADVDGELDALERQAVENHLAFCAECRSARSAELKLKLQLHDSGQAITMPAELRQRIIAELDRAHSRPAAAFKLPRLAWWIPLASLAAGACAIALFLLTSARAPDNRMFDAAIVSYVDAQKHFAPSPETSTVDGLALVLTRYFGYPLTWDFSPLGLKLIGGRVDQSGAGVVVKALYRSADAGNSLLCIMHGTNTIYEFPTGGRIVNGVHIYRYKNFSFALVQYNSAFSVMVTSAPASQLARTFEKEAG